MAFQQESLGNLWMISRHVCQKIFVYGICIKKQLFSNVKVNIPYKIFLTVCFCEGAQYIDVILFQFRKIRSG